MNFSRFKVAVLLLAVVTCSVCFLAGCRKSTAPKTTTAAVTDNGADADKGDDTKSLEKVIAQRRGWNPILTDTYSKPLPDFKFKDIDGKSHSLADYKGKNVMIVMWATWCYPCQQEIPHIIALRNLVAEDKLAIVAISNESAETVKATAKSKKMNYTVVAHNEIPPKPLSSIKGYPTSFFVNPDGTVKLVAEGTLHLGDMKSIIDAK